MLAKSQVANLQIDLVLFRLLLQPFKYRIMAYGSQIKPDPRPGHVWQEYGSR